MPDKAVKCPQCQGHGSVAVPAAQKVDPVCALCAGSGRIATRKCYCGRPLIYLLGWFASCADVACLAQAKKQERAKREKEGDPK